MLLTIFRRMSNLSDPNKPWEADPVWLQMRDEFAKFDEILDEKDPKKFAETYLRLQSIQLKHARSIKPDLHSILPLEIIVDSTCYLILTAAYLTIRSLYANGSQDVGQIHPRLQSVALAQHSRCHLARNLRTILEPQCC